MSSLVVHCKKSPYDIYIGRPSEWGNPFVIGKDGTREEVVAKYEVWLRKYIEDPDVKDRFMELKGKVLACWCAPLACHGDVIVQLLYELTWNGNFFSDEGFLE